MLILLGLYGGEGGIRTPDSLATMSDFESGAFNRALPPLRVLSTFFEWLGCLGVFTLFTPNHPVPVLVSLLSPEIDLAIDRRSLVFRSEMGVPHDHLKCPVPEQLCNRTQLDSGHNKSTGKRMAVAIARYIPESWPLRAQPRTIPATLAAKHAC